MPSCTDLEKHRAQYWKAEDFQFHAPPPCPCIYCFEGKIRIKRMKARIKK
jgi:hypothetical protein